MDSNANLTTTLTVAKHAVDAGLTLRIALLGAALASLPLLWTWWRQRRAAAGAPTASAKQRPWLAALTLTTLILTFDLVLFGSFTRLTDSGLGCPDWPGCYGAVTPLGAKEQISAAELAMPTGPVTQGKAWIEMLHRYFATAVGALITLMAVQSWRERRTSAVSPWWATVTLVWVMVQGAFGALTVTMKLYPAIVTTHLLLGLGLLALLAVQWGLHRRAAAGAANGAATSQASSTASGATLNALTLPTHTLRLVWLMAGLLLVQLALGGWVSTNHAVLACQDFPTCHGRWWPSMNFSEGFTIARELGRSADGVGYLSMEALTAIHVAHRLFAFLVVAVALWVVRLLWLMAQARRMAMALLGLVLWQLASGISNVVLGWPMGAALAHIAGAAAWVVWLAALLTQSHAAPKAMASQRLRPGLAS
jgi:heme a synthase